MFWQIDSESCIDLQHRISEQQKNHNFKYQDLQSVQKQYVTYKSGYSTF